MLERFAFPSDRETDPLRVDRCRSRSLGDAVSRRKRYPRMTERLLPRGGLPAGEDFSRVIARSPEALVLHLAGPRLGSFVCDPPFSSPTPSGEAVAIVLLHTRRVSSDALRFGHERSRTIRAPNDEPGGDATHRAMVPLRDPPADREPPGAAPVGRAGRGRSRTNDSGRSAISRCPNRENHHS